MQPPVRDNITVNDEASEYVGLFYSDPNGGTEASKSHKNLVGRLDMQQVRSYENNRNQTRSNIRPSSARPQNRSNNNMDLSDRRPSTARVRRTPSPSRRSSARSYNVDDAHSYLTHRSTCDCAMHPHGWVPQAVKNHDSHRIPLGPNTPGPGNYTPNYSFVLSKSPSSARSTARRFSSPPTTPHQTPGPSYDPKIKNDIHNPIGWRNSFGKADRFEKSNRHVSPGPRYKPLYSQIEPNTRGVSFPKEVRSSHARNATPGPGQYSSEAPTSARAPAVAFGYEKKLVCNINSVPGPGTYSAKVDKETPAFSFGKSKKVADFGVRSVSPGPGSYRPNYDTVKEQCGGVTFGTEKRGDTPRNNTPSSAYYTPRIDMIKEGTPAFSFGSSSTRSIKPRTEGPGPVYNPNDSVIRQRAPGYSFSRANNNQTAQAKSPGPKYNVSESFKKAVDTSHAVGFGTAKRDLSKQSSTPGPAHYNADKANKQGGISIGKDQRFRYQTSFTPPPNAYTPRLPPDSSGPVSFGKQSRAAQSRDFTPGPADYRTCDCFVRAKAPGAVLHLTG